MVATPRFLQPDGSYSSTPTYTTTRETRFFTGTIDAGTADVFVSINGRAWSNDPDLVTFEGTTFTCPNVAAYTNGLELLAGVNTISVMVQDTSGVESTAAIATVTLVQESDVTLVTEAPTGLVVEQLDGKVTLTIDGIVGDGNVQGYNIYAATAAGGGSEGYAPCNVFLISTGATTETTDEVGTLTFDGTVALDSEGNPVASPQYLNVAVTQQDLEGAVLQADANELLQLNPTATSYRFTATVQQIDSKSTFSFIHDRAGSETSEPPTVPNGAFASLPDTEYLYYIATAVYYDSTRRVEIESSASAEVAARPVRVTTLATSLPTVGRQQVVESMLLNVLRSQPQIAVHPGTVLRDTAIDPFSTEMERIRLVLDFLHRASSFHTLLEIDDPYTTGVSISVVNSSYKTALKDAFQLISDSQVQDLIDGAFDKLAANFGETRSAGRAAAGVVTYYTNTAPTDALIIPIGATVGAGTISFAVQQATSISPVNAATAYDPTTGQYAVTVPIRALSAGTAGNLGPNQINTAVNGTHGLRVTNSSATYGGLDQDTNHTLAVRSMRKLASVDTGTRQGYYNLAANTAGVSKVLAVEAGSALMQRDFDVATKNHRGGKVDLWVQGDQLSTISETFSFAYQKAENIQFSIEGDPTALTFRATDPNLTAANPITEMLDHAVAGYGLRNITTGVSYDLTGATYPSYDTVQLDTALVQPTVAIGDVLLGDYRYKVSSRYTPAHQPVRALSSLISTLSVDDGGTGTVGDGLYTLHHATSPLGMGRSTKAGDYVEVVDDGSAGAPTGNLFTVTDESHILVGVAPAYLGKLGVNSLTLRVFNADKTVEYSGPWAAAPDFTVNEGTQTVPASFQRTSASTIASGQSLVCDYSHTENFTLKYTHNSVMGVLQAKVEAAKHITADVIVKEALPTAVDIAGTIILTQNQTAGTVDTAVRTNLINFFKSQRLGGRVYPSDIVEVIDSTAGVSHVLLPLTGLYLASGALVTREAITVAQSGDAYLVTAWSTPTVNTWLLENPFTYATTTGGGPVNEFRGVYEDDSELDLRTTDPNLLSAATGRAYIITSAGISVPGYTGSTGNCVLVTLPTGDSPTQHSYAATYVVGTNVGVKDLDPGPAGYLITGDLGFTYTTAVGR